MGVELAEVSSLLSLAMPAANVASLSSGAAAEAIEVRPRERSFQANAAPIARWVIVNNILIVMIIIT